MPPAANKHTFLQMHLFPILCLFQALCHVFISRCPDTYRCQTCFPLQFLFLLCMNSDVMTVVILVMGIRMQNHKCSEMENAFPIFKVSLLVRVHTNSHHNGHNKMTFAVSDVLIIVIRLLLLTGDGCLCLTHSFVGQD